MANFGELLRRYRAAAGLTQAALAQRAGLSRRALAELERGAHAHPRAGTLANLASALGLDEQQRAQLEDAAQRGGPATLVVSPVEVTHILPRPISTFVGREADLAEVTQLLRSNRLVTLVGTGGIGKTRLAVEAARSIQAELADGALMVDLAPVSDGAMVPQAFATALGVHEESNHPVIDTLREHLRRRDILLLVDNCEHVLAAVASVLQTLLPDAEGVRVLATSRQALDIAGEVVWRVPPLRLPPTEAPLEELLDAEAVRLFATRATAANPGFRLTPDNASVVVALCRGLDGLPLAIELAAARARVLSVDQISWYLGDRSLVLRAAPHSATGRHATLRATIDWSHSLLSTSEQVLFRRLAVFAGDFSLDAVAAVCTGDGIQPGIIEVVELVCGLVEKSLVVADLERGPEPRYRLLETLRQYATERLQTAGEESYRRARHVQWLLEHLALEDPTHGAVDEPKWLERVAREYDNCRAALEWAARTPTSACQGLKLSVNLYRYWLINGLPSEGRRWGKALRERVDMQACPPMDLAWSMVLDATLTLFQGDFVEGLGLAESALALARTHGTASDVGEVQSIVSTLRANGGDLVNAWAEVAESVSTLRTVGPDVRLGAALMGASVVARLRGDIEQSIRDGLEAYAIARRTGQPFYLGHIVSGLGLACLDRGETRRAREYFLEALEVRRAIGERAGVMGSLRDLGRTALMEGDLAAAEAYLTESLDLARQIGDRAGAGQALRMLGDVARERGDVQRALGLLQEGLRLHADLRHALLVPEALEEIALTASQAGMHTPAVRLVAAAAAGRSAMALPAGERCSGVVERARRAAGESACADAWADGQRTSLGDVVEEALRLQLRATKNTRRAPDVLTPREWDVARLLAEGLSNRAISERLVISEATAEVHVRRILSKLGATSRAQAAVWAAQRLAEKNSP